MGGSKSFFYGLGTGLMIGATIIQLTHTSEESIRATETVDLTKTERSIEELRQEANELGYQLYNITEKRYTEEELQSKLAEEINMDILTETASPNSNPLEQKQSKDQGIEFTISPGSGLRSISQTLLDHGLISDREQFLRVMEERGISGKVRAKTYRFSDKPTLERLITELTNP
jgi:hypothetical protein